MSRRMNSSQIREEYLRFFEEKDHLRIPSSPLIPIGDPTLLLTSAGVVQIKPYFTGETTPPSPRLVSCQKCFRTTDIDSVGDTKHLTFFEMLGNFSVGDYFKKEAIEWAWEFVTERLHLPPERLWIGIFLDDDESFGYWREIGIPAERILRFGEEENFWGPPGEEGPCGPCSEIHYDFGEEFSCGKPTCGPACDCERFVELWNLVFTQFYQDRDGKRTPLPKPNIDTGLGLERTAAVVQGTRDVYNTDLFTPIVKRICELTGKEYGSDEAVDYAIRIVAEHGRGIAFLIADGVVPSNEGRGYVLRRVLRRAVRFGRKLGLDGPFLAEIARVVIDSMGGQYPELQQNKKFMLEAIQQEEARFLLTLDVGITLLDQIIGQAKYRKDTSIEGADIFKLYDTYGFPPEVTAEIAREHGLSVDMEGFEKEMERQKERARAVHKFGGGRGGEIYEQLKIESPKFVGYDKLKAQPIVAAILAGGKNVQKAREGDEVEIFLLGETPFYPEGGGQVGDTGEFRGPDGRVEVTDTQMPLTGLIVHRGRVIEGTISVGEPVEAEVNPVHRTDTARNHTATHLLHAALRQVIGSHAMQSGSLVAPDRLRFDFSHLLALSQGELEEVQHIVNEKIEKRIKVKYKHMPFAQAIAEGALAFFGDKYGDSVRVVEMGDGSPFSLELCGGTHVSDTGDIWRFQIIDEGSIGSGMRRIEAVTARGAERWISERISTLDSLAERLQVPLGQVPKKVSDLASELDRERKRAAALERELARKSVEELVAKRVEVDGITVLAVQVQASSVDAMRQMGDLLKARLGSGAIVLGAIINEKPSFVAMITPDLVDKGVHAGEIVKQVAKVAGGGGGGSAEIAQAGGKDKGKLKEALDAVRGFIKR